MNNASFKLLEPPPLAYPICTLKTVRFFVIPIPPAGMISGTYPWIPPHRWRLTTTEVAHPDGQLHPHQTCPAIMIGGDARYRGDNLGKETVKDNDDIGARLPSFSYAIDLTLTCFLLFPF